MYTTNRKPIATRQQVEAIESAIAVDIRPSLLIGLQYRPTSRCRLCGVSYAVSISCGKRHIKVESPSVRPSVCPVDRQQQRRAAGLLLRSGAGSRYRSTAAACSRAMSAVRVIFGPTAKEVQHSLLVNEIVQRVRSGGAADGALQTTPVQQR